MKHDFRGIITRSKVEPDKLPEPPEAWSIRDRGSTHRLYPASSAALFLVDVHISPAGNCRLVVAPKDAGRGANVTLESHFAVDGFTTDAEIADLRRKAKTLAQHLLKRQAALL